ncbi:MAG: hypothetical protein O7G84_00830 [Gammaproteobacteria bacterium]|nr:hypothetical protein [Gammaproteobacteria bacterium]
MPSPPVNSLPCPGCRALQSEVLRDRREFRDEVHELEGRLRRLRRAAAERCGIVPLASMTDAELIERLTGEDGS